MTNAQKFQETFGIYATEMWTMPEHDFLKWLNADTPQTDLLVKTPHKSRESREKNCETCRDKDAYDEWEGNCDECENGSIYTPQTDCLTCRYNSDEWDSPKCDSCSKAHSNYEPQTDCAWK